MFIIFVLFVYLMTHTNAKSLKMYIRRDITNTFNVSGFPSSRYCSSKRKICSRWSWSTTD